MVCSRSSSLLTVSRQAFRPRMTIRSTYKIGHITPSFIHISFVNVMTHLRSFLSLALLPLSLFGSAKGKPQNQLTLFVGTYTQDSPSKGIYVYRFNQDTGNFSLRSSVKAGNPSFVALSPNGNRLYAVSEFNDGRQGAYSFDFDPKTGQLSNPIFVSTKAGDRFDEPKNQPGSDPCNLYTDGKCLITANYSGGDISAFKLDKQGRLQGTAQQTRFRGRDSAAVSHIHCGLPTPDGKYFLATDLGNDRIHRFDFTPSGTEVLAQPTVAFEVKRGEGPRHITFDKGGRYLYLINELGGTCVVMRYNDGQLTEMQTLMADEGGGRGSADIHISPDGKFLYTSHRLKKDGIAIFAINPQTGLLTKVGYQQTGIHPRNFTITPNGKYLLVACRDDNAIQIFRRDARTGLLTNTGKRINLGKPVCLVLRKY